MTRRDFILKLPLAVAGATCLFGLFPSKASAEEAAKKPMVRPPRPLDTCGGWVDQEGNGICDRSESGQKPCGAKKCAGHKDNLLRQNAKERGAPEGTCAAWVAEAGKGFCSLSSRAANPCNYVKCPAHKSAVAGAAVPKI